MIEVARYIVCDDVGRAVNPLNRPRAGCMAAWRQGYGQAVLEHTAYDPVSGQLLAGSLMDYALPRASDLPDIEVDLIEVPCGTNPLGVKGAGEAGAVGSPPAMINAIVDALATAGVKSIDIARDAGKGLAGAAGRLSASRFEVRNRPPEGGRVPISNGAPAC